VPRIIDTITGIAVYIYQDLEAAQNGEAFGGSGFLVDVPHETNGSLHSYYVVTNKHVVQRAGTPVIRINRKSGDSPFECFPTKQDEWESHPEGDDIAVFLLKTESDWKELKINVVRLDQFVTPQLVVDEDIGIGDDTVMVGRFINHEGKQQNSPAVRFGNIAMMPTEKIVCEHDIAQEAFLVEVRSLPGYSGSAVLIYSPCATNDMSQRRRGHERIGLPTPKKGDELKMPSEQFFDGDRPKGPFLLGIDFCHIHRRSEVKHPASGSAGWFVEENTGMAGVIPAWKIIDILKSEKLMKQRRQVSDRINAEASKVSLDSAERPSQATQLTKDGIEIPILTEDQFFSDLQKASRKIEPRKN
jgi:hypothetical protein